MTLPAHPLSNAVLATIPSPGQGVWYVGPVPLRAYALCIIVGILVAIFWSDRRWVARGGQRGTITDVAIFAVPFGLIGGRLYHVATDWHKYFGPGRDPLDALKIWQGGLGIWGAVALGAVGAWIACRRYGVPLPAVADAVAPGLVLAQAIGRLGNWFNQELYGASTNVPWGLELYRRVNPLTGRDDPIGGEAINSVPVDIVHPTFLYELLWNVGVALLVVWADRKFRMGHGRVFALYVAGYTLGRLWIEIMRTDEATLVLGIRINVFTSLVVFALAVAYLLLVKGKREDPALLAGTVDERVQSSEAESSASDEKAVGPAPAGLDVTPESTSNNGSAAESAGDSQSSSDSEPGEASQDSGQQKRRTKDSTVEE